MDEVGADIRGKLVMGSTDNSLEDLVFLVIDDEDFIRSLLQRVLRKLGATSIRSAATGMEALHQIDEDGAPDIILCDLNMPEMDGVEFIRHLMGRDFRGGIVLISGEDRRILETVAQLGVAQNLNILGVLPKPISAQSLLALVSDFHHKNAASQTSQDVTVSAEELADALTNRVLVTHFQPKVNACTRVLTGVETLVRWPHPIKGMISPDSFIPLAESHGLIDQLTDLVLDCALKQAAVWQAAGLRLKIAVNVSVDNLHTLTLPETIMQAAMAAGVNPHDLVLEVTESRLMTDVVTPLEILTRLRLKGIELSIDDFGTGHSSLEQLKRIPFTELKVDRAFVHGACRDETALSILESSVSLAKRLGMTVVAEGVEDEEDWNLVAQLGVNTVQGYFVSRPMPGEDILQWWKDWQNRADVIPG